MAWEKTNEPNPRLVLCVEDCDVQGDEWYELGWPRVRTRARDNAHHMGRWGNFG